MKFLFVWVLYMRSGKGKCPTATLEIQVPVPKLGQFPDFRSKLFIHEILFWRRHYTVVIMIALFPQIPRNYLILSDDAPVPCWNNSHVIIVNLIPAIIISGEKNRWNTIGKKAHLNWSGCLKSDVFNPCPFLIKSDATLSHIKMCLHSAVFGSMYGSVCTYVNSLTNYKLLQNRN